MLELMPHVGSFKKPLDSEFKDNLNSHFKVAIRRIPQCQRLNCWQILGRIMLNFSKTINHSTAKSRNRMTILLTKKVKVFQCFDAPGLKPAW